jgi:hypothetical protein
VQKRKRDLSENGNDMGGRLLELGRRLVRKRQGDYMEDAEKREALKREY